MLHSKIGLIRYILLENQTKVKTFVNLLSLLIMNKKSRERRQFEKEFE